VTVDGYLVYTGLDNIMDDWTLDTKPNMFVIMLSSFFNGRLAILFLRDGIILRPQWRV